MMLENPLEENCNLNACTKLTQSSHSTVHNVHAALQVATEAWRMVTILPVYLSIYLIFCTFMSLVDALGHAM